MVTIEKTIVLPSVDDCGQVCHLPLIYVKIKTVFQFIYVANYCFGFIIYTHLVCNWLFYLVFPGFSQCF